MSTRNEIVHLVVTYPPADPVAACGYEGKLEANNATRVFGYVTCHKCEKTNEFRRRSDASQFHGEDS